MNRAKQADPERKDLTVVIPVLNESGNLRLLLPEIWNEMRALGVDGEILVVDGGSVDDSQKIAEDNGARAWKQSQRGYGSALMEGFAAARGQYVLTMDADYSHEPLFIRMLWEARADADLTIASRYVPGGEADMNLLRAILSMTLNHLYRLALDLPYRDVSSGFRLYRKAALGSLRADGRDFDFLPELLVRLFMEGYRIRELPFRYRPRQEGRSHAKLVRFGWAFLRTLLRMRKLRHSVDSADYDERAFDSIIPPQRYWQRKRFEIIMSFLNTRERVLDVGCGTSRVLQSLPAGVGMDIRLNKLRYLRRRVPMLLAGSLTHLPFKTGSFEQVVCSEVIEHVPKELVLLSEFRRVLRSGGRLILGTPDYSSWWWRIIEGVYAVLIPGGYAHEHINHHTRSGLQKELEENGFEVKEVRTICRSEMIFKAVAK